MNVEILETRRGARRHVPLLLAAVIALGCAGSSGPSATGTSAVSLPGGAPAVAVAPDTTGSGLTDRHIPPAMLPPPGQCRAWTPSSDEGAAAAGPVGRCSELRESIPAGSWLIYRPADDAANVRVWQYGEDREVLSQRIYDAATGQIIRVVAPLGS